MEQSCVNPEKINGDDDAISKSMLRSYLIYVGLGVEKGHMSLYIYIYTHMYWLNTYVLSHVWKSGKNDDVSSSTVELEADL